MAAKAVPRFVGADATMRDLKKLIDQLPDRFGNALYAEAQIEATECKKRTPVDTGALRASIHVEGPFRKGRRIWATVVAGGPTVQYAFIVHEDLDAFHSNGEAKYIERPLAESAPFISARVAARIDAGNG